MTERMKKVRETFLEQAGPRVSVHGGTLTWGMSLSGDDELALWIAIDGKGPPRLHGVLVAAGTDLVVAAAAWGQSFNAALRQVPIAAPDNSA